MRLEYLAKQIQDGANEKGIDKITKLQMRMKDYCGLSPERVRKVWYGDEDAKISDYIIVTKCLGCEFDLTL